jgi:hypothetical protein
MYATLKCRVNEELLGFIRGHAPLPRSVSCTSSLNRGSGLPAEPGRLLLPAIHGVGDDVTGRLSKNVFLRHTADFLVPGLGWASKISAHMLRGDFVVRAVLFQLLQILVFMIRSDRSSA